MWPNKRDTDDWQPRPRPPLGVMPKWRWLELRQRELVKAVQRFRDDGAKVPTKWIMEWHWIAGLLDARKGERNE